jgi:hypothetical protein
MANSPLKPLVDSTLDVMEGMFYLSMVNTNGWAKSNALWHFIYAVRVFRSWMVETFQTEFEKHKYFALACANEGFLMNEVEHHSPLHALGHMAEQVTEAFVWFDRSAELQSLPLTLSTRKVATPSPSTNVPNERINHEACYQSLFEDVLDAWPVKTRTPGAPRKSYTARTLESTDPRTGLKIDGETFVDETIDLIRKLRDVDRINESVAGRLSQNQWVSLLNLWVASDIIEQSFTDLKSSLNAIDHAAWWSGIDRQLARMELFHGLAGTSSVFVDRSDGPLVPRVGECPVVIKDNDAYVRDQKLPRLTPARFAVVKALVNAYPKRLRTKELIDASFKSDAGRYLNEIASTHPEWAKVLSLPEGYGDGFSIFRSP